MKMSNFFLLFLILLQIFFGNCFNPSKINYCKIKCNRGGEYYVSTGCNCFKSRGREEINVDNILEFRQVMRDYHNELRNKLARGDEKAKGYPTAADMQVLNYDLELEHLARCYILSTFVKGHDKCRGTSYCQREQGAGQNLYGSNMKNETLEIVKHGIYKWYIELDQIPQNQRDRVRENYDVKHEWHAGHFTQVVWASAIRIGCVRAWIPNSPEEVYRFVLACNYAGPNEFCPGNVMQTKMYQSGAPCSLCGAKKCNKDTAGGKYEALCGELTPILPHLYKIKDGGTRKIVNKSNVVLSIIVNIFVSYMK